MYIYLDRYTYNLYINNILVKFPTSLVKNRTLKGFICWLHMCHCKMWSLFWPDPLHLTARRTALTLVNSGSTQFLKKLNRLFRMSRGPFHSSKFGKQIQACRQQLLAGLESGSLSESMVEAVLPGCARDAGRTEFGVADLKVLLKSKAGQDLSKFNNSECCILLMSNNHLQ